MSQDAALVQLVDMGIPGGRARAALRRSKGDVMSAAERVFGGDFDDIPSDDDGLDENSKGSAAGPSNPIVHVRTLELPSVIALYEIQTPDEQSATSSTSEVLHEGEDPTSDDDMVDDIDLDDEPSEDRLSSDPYAGIFFSKERTEHVIENIEEPEWANVGETSGHKSSIRVQVLNCGEWMKGCPEGNEQSLLFQLYNSFLSPVKCSSGCEHNFDRKQKDFFLLFPDFPAYIEYLDSIVRGTCPTCGRVTCLACGESAAPAHITPEVLNPHGQKSGKSKVGSASSLEREALLHCLNLQGVIIGVGLHMLEQAFAEGKDPPRKPSAAQSTNNKRQKTSALDLKKALGSGPVWTTPEFTGLPDLDNEDLDENDEDYFSQSNAAGPVSGSTRGTGYDGRDNEDRTGQLAAEKAQLAADATTGRLLSLIQIYLPSLARSSGTRTSDHLVHPTTLAHLRRRSGFVNDLLRNDSLLDMSKRSELYCALLDWLKIISSHEALASMLAMPQMRPVKSESLPRPSSSGPHSPKQIQITYEGASSPRELLESCCIQAQAALKGLQSTTATQLSSAEEDEEIGMRLSIREVARRAAKKWEEESIDENVQLKLFCDRIISSANHIDNSLIETKGRPFVDRMRESLPKLPANAVIFPETDLGTATDEGLIKIYEEWALKARFQYCDMSVVSDTEGESKVAFNHAYSTKIQGIDNMDAPKRSLAIAKELAILTRSLPAAWHSTIFLRVDETRVDCLKAMIIGPEGTPYENGCFIFDIFLPLEYNFKCPQVQSMTTNGGKFRYNPNLYQDGKVCLSLLGTWAGPGWIAGQSTLLQVLISIQSLILCEEPYLNEPGWAGSGGSPISKAYSSNVRRMTLIDAMGNNIRNPPSPFEQEIKTHFRLKAKSIRKQLDSWKKLDDDGNVCADSHGGVPGKTATTTCSKTPFDKYSDELRKLLDDLVGKEERATPLPGVTMRVTRSGAKKSGVVATVKDSLGFK